MYLPIYSTDAHTRSLSVNTSLFQHEPLLTIAYDNYYEEVANFRTFPFKEVFASAPLVSKKGKNPDQIEYYDLVATFDIETTTINREDTPESFMYIWQFCIESVVFMGRTWQEFQELLNIISTELNLHIEGSEEMTGRALVVYSHNLSYEFQFCRYYLPPLINPLFTDKYKPLLIPTSNGIVFRCSSRLFNKSLEKVTKGFPHEKLSGEDFDYSETRTPQTILTSEQLSYCYNDVRGLSEAIRDRLNHDRYNIANIPLTSTGYVRKDCQRAMNKNPQNRRNFLETKLTPQIYTLCRDSFRGGNTHANAAITGLLLHDIGSHDISSSYPAQSLLRTFPRGKWVQIDPNDILEHFGHIIKHNCLLMRVVLFDIKYKRPDNIAPLSVSKCIIDRTAGIKEDNGRVYEAGKLETAVTEIDLVTIIKGYKIGGIKILESFASARGKLPAELRETIFKYYELKTKLKHSKKPDDIYNYNRAKEQLNSTYGMMVQRIDRTEFKLIGNTYIPIYKPLKDQIDDFYNSRSSFLNYSHGVYITSWARYQLQTAIDIVGSDMVYCDTDSVKYRNPEKYAAAFEELNNRMIALASKAGAVAYDYNNNPVYIGTFDYEGIYTDFITLGAKKYLYSYDNGHTIYSTISGVNKKVGQEYFTHHGFEDFKDGQIIADSGKLTAYYNDTPPHVITVNGCKINTASSVSLLDAPYTINVKGEYQQFIDYLRKSVEQYYLV